MSLPPTRRDMMRELYRQSGGNEEQTVATYAAAERHGRVERRGNSRDIDARFYARRLLADGLARRWLRT